MLVSLGVFAVASGSAPLLAACTGVGCLAVAHRSYVRSGAVTALTAFAVAASVAFGFGNVVAIRAHGTASGVWYGSPHDFFAAQQIATLGLLCSLLGFRLISGRARASTNALPVPTKGWSQEYVSFASALLVTVWAARILGVTWGLLGSFGVIFSMGGSISIFLFRTHRFLPRNHRAYRAQALNLAAAIAMVAEVSYHLVSSLLRTNALWPVVAFVLPAFVFRERSARQRRRLATWTLAAAMTLFVVSFQAFGEIRTEVRGQERLTAITSSDQFGSGVVGDAFEAVAIRFSTVSSISAITRLVRTEGTIDGESLAPLLVAPIPRVLWRDKPIISPGEGFAERIGTGRALSDGSHSNAVNMTVPGEFYWNFGFLGVAIGGALYGVVLGGLWRLVGPLRLAGPVWTHVAAFLLVTDAIFIGSSASVLLEMVTSVVAAFIVGLVLSTLSRRVVRPRHQREVDLSGAGGPVVRVGPN